MEYILHLFMLICIYTLLSHSLNLSAGFTRLISLAHAVFYGIGAYSSAILSTRFGFSIWLNIPLAMLFSGGIAFLVSLIALRTVEDYFIICTLGIQVIIFSIMNNWMDLTNGPLGIPGIPSVSFWASHFNSKYSFLLLAVSFVTIIWLVLRNVSASGFGKTLKAIAEDEIYTMSIGKNVYFYKVVSFTVSAMLAAIPGVLYAHYISYIDPTSFTVTESIFVLSIVIIGGLGNLTGSFFAAAFLVLLPEALRFVGMPEGIAANLRQIIYGLILVILMTTGKNGVNKLINSKGKN